MSQTPIEFLVEQLQSAGFIPKDSIAINYIIEEAKKKESLEKQHTFVSGQLPTNKEIDLIIDQDLPFSEEYQKYSEKEKTLMLAATKAGAKWFHSSLIEGNFR